MNDPVPTLHRQFEPVFADCSLTTTDRATIAFLDGVLADIGYRPAGKYLEGVRRILISLYEAQDAIAGRDHMLVAIPASLDYWKNESSITRQVIRTLRNKLKGASILTLRRPKFNGTGFGGPPMCDLFAIQMPRFEQYRSVASVVSVVSNLQATTKKVDSSVRITLPKRSREASDLLRLNGIISEGKVSLGDRVVIAGVDRKFSNFDLKRGGRFYGPYTNKPKQTRFKDMSINGEQICEVDISACSLTLFAAMSGHELPAGDLYAGFAEKPREITKSLVVEMFGNGSNRKNRLSRPNVEKLESMGIKGDGDLSEVRKQLNHSFPFLSRLEKGVLDSEALSYHESEIIQGAIFKLYEQHGATACPMHDGLIVARRYGEAAQVALESSFLTTVCRWAGPLGLE